MRVCPFVLDNDFRNPAFTALEAASLDFLTDGRLDLGLGSGWNKPDYEIIGMPFDPPGMRVDRLAETIRIVRGAFGGEPFSFDGEHYRITGIGGPGGVLARPCPPILVGGGGKRMLTLAGRYADIASITPIARRDGSGLETADITADAMDRKIGWLRAAAGERWPEITVNVLVQHLAVTAAPAETAAALEKLSDDWEMAPDELAASPLILVGTIGEIADRMAERRRRWKISYYSVFGPFLEAFVPIVAEIRRRESATDES